MGMFKWDLFTVTSQISNINAFVLLDLNRNSVLKDLRLVNAKLGSLELGK